GKAVAAASAALRTPSASIVIVSLLLLISQAPGTRVIIGFDRPPVLIADSMPKAFDSSIGRRVIVAQSALNERVLVEIRGGDEHDDDKRGEVRFPGEPIAAALFYSGLNHTS